VLEATQARRAREDAEAREALGLSDAERSVLVIEPDPHLQETLARLLKRGGILVVGASSLDGGRSLLREFEVDLVLVAESVTLPDPMVVIADLVGLRPGARFVVVVEPESPSSGVRPARYEAIEYVERPDMGDGLRYAASL
jgi:DNA-binding NtrC family response regulator